MFLGRPCVSWIVSVLSDPPPEQSQVGLLLSFPLRPQNNCAAPAGQEHSDTFLQEHACEEPATLLPCCPPSRASLYLSLFFPELELVLFSRRMKKVIMGRQSRLESYFRVFGQWICLRCLGTWSWKPVWLGLWYFWGPTIRTESSSRAHLSDFSSLMGLSASVPWCVKILGNKLRYRGKTDVWKAPLNQYTRPSPSCLFYINSQMRM